MSQGLNTPAEVVDILTQNSINKVTYPFMKTLLLGIMAGLMISFGADAALIAGHAIDNMSVGRVVSGAIFPVGLISIVLTGSELLTGSCLNVLGIPTGKIGFGGVAKNLVYVAIANAIGAVLLAVTVYAMNQLDLSSARMGAYAIKTAVGKVAGIFFPIWVFVACGFEHSVANMFYLPLGFLAKGNPDYAAAATELFGITQAQMDGLDIPSILVDNLLPVTIGNIIGGSIMLAGFYYLALKKYTK